MFTHSKFTRQNIIRDVFDALSIFLRKIISPYNVVKISTLDRGWYDRDGVMLHAMMQILVDFVDGEWGGPKKRMYTLKEWLRENDDKWYTEQIIQSIEYDLKIINLYIQWKKFIRDGIIHDIPEEVENEMLMNVLKVRKGLWS